MSNQFRFDCLIYSVIHSQRDQIFLYWFDYAIPAIIFSKSANSSKFKIYLSLHPIRQWNVYKLGLFVTCLLPNIFQCLFYF